MQRGKPFGKASGSQAIGCSKSGSFQVPKSKAWVRAGLLKMEGWQPKSTVPTGKPLHKTSRGNFPIPSRDLPFLENHQKPWGNGSAFLFKRTMAEKNGKGSTPWKTWPLPSHSRAPNPQKSRPCHLHRALGFKVSTEGEAETAPMGDAPTWTRISGVPVVFLRLPGVAMTLKKWAHDPSILGNDPIFEGPFRQGPG